MVPSVIAVLLLLGISYLNSQRIRDYSEFNHGVFPYPLVVVGARKGAPVPCRFY
jgi:hypothetical protein